jgi:DNA-binding transcriptional LysR family regulator
VESTKAKWSFTPMSDSLTFRLLRYIKASAETLNFTRAVFVAQSSLSHQIGKFEDNIDLIVFDRLQNRLRLTPAGRIVAAYAENTLREWDQTLVMARAVQRNEVPPLRLGFSSFVNAKLLEKFREGHDKMFSGCVIQLFSGDVETLFSVSDVLDVLLGYRVPRDIQEATSKEGQHTNYANNPTNRLCFRIRSLWQLWLHRTRLWRRLDPGKSGTLPPKLLCSILVV